MGRRKRINAFVLIVAMIGGCLIGTQVSLAATYPDHPIKLIVGFSPGGPASTMSTAISKRVSEFLPQAITVEHKPGASATLAATYVANAKPDGYTLFTASISPVLIAPLIKKELTYTLESFIPIIGYGMSPTIIIVKKGRWKSLKEMIADAKKNPGKYTYSTQGVNSNSDFMVRLLEEQAGIDLKMVPFPGNAETITALLGGHIDVAVVGGTAGLYQAGRIDVLASGQKERLAEYPNAPTLAELGYPIFFNANYFLCAPKGTPKEIINTLNEAHKKAFAKYGKELNTMFRKFEMYSDFKSPEEVDKDNKDRRDKIRKIVKKMGLLVPNR